MRHESLVPRTPILVGTRISRANMEITQHTEQFSLLDESIHDKKGWHPNESEDADFQKLTSLLMDRQKPKCEFRSRKLSQQTQISNMLVNQT